AGDTDERARNHAAHSVLPREDLAGDATRAVELVQRNRLFVSGDLEDRVRARVDDPLAGALMLFAELLDDLCSARRPVAEHAAPGAIHERVDHVVGKAEWVRRHRLRRDYAHELPVPCGRVLTLRALHETAGDRRRARLRRAPLEWLDVAEAERL